jgi:hypothetical protein
MSDQAQQQQRPKKATFVDPEESLKHHLKNSQGVFDILLMFRHELLHKDSQAFADQGNAWHAWKNMNRKSNVVIWEMDSHVTDEILPKIAELDFIKSAAPAKGTPALVMILSKHGLTKPVNANAKGGASKANAMKPQVVAFVDVNEGWTPELIDQFVCHYSVDSQSSPKCKRLANTSSASAPASSPQATAANANANANAPASEENSGASSGGAAKKKTTAPKKKPAAAKKPAAKKPAASAKKPTASRKKPVKK